MPTSGVGKFAQTARQQQWQKRTRESVPNRIVNFNISFGLPNFDETDKKSVCTYSFILIDSDGWMNERTNERTNERMNTVKTRY